MFLSHECSQSRTTTAVERPSTLSVPHIAVSSTVARLVWSSTAATTAVTTTSAPLSYGTTTGLVNRVPYSTIRPASPTQSLTMLITEPMVNMPWAMTSGSPTDVAKRSSQWMRLRSRLAPVYCTRFSRLIWIASGGRAWPTSTSLTDSTALFIRSLPSADHDGRGGGAHRLALGGGQLAAGGDHGVATGLPHRVNRQHAHDLVTGSERTVVDKPLLAVDDPAEVDARLRVSDELPVALLGNHDSKGGRSDDVAIAARTGVCPVGVHGVIGAHRLGELANLLPAHGIRRGSRVGVPGEACVDGHGDHPRGWAGRQPGGTATTAPADGGGGRRGMDRKRSACSTGRTRLSGNAKDQRVSRCVVCLVQRGQNLASSNRSGLLRRFFLVM